MCTHWGSILFKPPELLFEVSAEFGEMSEAKVHRTLKMSQAVRCPWIHSQKDGSTRG